MDIKEKRPPLLYCLMSGLSSRIPHFGMERFMMTKQEKILDICGVEDNHA